MKAGVITLFEGHYHLGAAALINSLYAAGFDGVVICGHRGPRPPWAESAAAIADRIELRWVPVDAAVHLTYHKPAFMRECWEKHCTDAELLYYFDPDIVLKAPWSVIERWAADGVALVEDINVNFPAGHPYRLGWLDFFSRYNAKPIRTLDRYYNAGFIGLPRAHAAFLDCWAATVYRARAEIGDLNALKNSGPHALFHSADQDAMNMALMLTDVPINAAGPEAMDFLPGGHLLSHAAGGTKPWRGGFIGDALRGRPPGPAQKRFYDFTHGPLPVLPRTTLAWRRLTLQLAALIGRFYRRT